jgi:thiol-disulfide isomerase/thioredoxin
MKTRSAALVLPLVLALAGTVGLPSVARAASGLPSSNTAWVAAATDVDIDRAFARARAEKKPLLLYWGATWCPPCNQLKATLFNRQDFATLARSFVPVSVDGDRPGAQKLGQRFKVVGYPTTVLFSADGKEITRLPGEVDAPQALAVLRLGLAGGRPVKAVLADALAGKALAATDWRLLAFYSWETGEGQAVAKAEVPGTLVRLAVASAAPGSAAEAEITTRLWLKALAASDEGKGVKPDAALRERLMRVLADPVQSRLHSDVLVASAPEIVRNFESADPEFGAAPSRAPLLAAYDTALQGLQADASLSRADRLGALTARVDLARLDVPKSAVQVNLPEPLLKSLRDHVARDDREVTDGYERQAVITEAAYTLGRAGLWAQSEALLTANLAKSNAPYYLMSQLAGNARRLGHTDEALRWYAQAYNRSEGPATRLQWGGAYLAALVELAPQDAATIEKTAAQMFSEAAKDRSAFAGRSARSLQRAGAQLISWNQGGQHLAVLRRLQTQLDGVCAQVGAAAEARRACVAVFKPAAA